MWRNVTAGATLTLIVTGASAFADCPTQLPITTLYVSTLGDDAWSGLSSAPQGGSNGPLATLLGAREKLRLYRTNGCLTTTQPVRVKILPGEYFLANTVTFEVQDSGTAIAPVIFEAMDARPIFTGGVRLTGFTEQSGNWVVTLPESDSNPWNFEQLWVNGRRAIPARSPNRDRYSEFDATRGFHQRQPYSPVGIDPRFYVEFPTSVLTELTNLTPQQLQDVQVTHMDHWTMSRNFIQAIDGARVYWAGKTWIAPSPPAEFSRLEFLNVPTALDAPGEFYLDRATRVLKYRPFPGETIATAEVIAPVATAPELLHIGSQQPSGVVQYLRFVGLGFRYSPYLLRRTWIDNDKFTGGYNDSYAGFSLPATITVRNGRNIELDNLEVAHTGAAGIWIRGTSSELVQVKNSRLFDLGGGGIKVLEYDPAVAYQISHSNVGSTIKMEGFHRIENNVVHSGGRSFYDTVGIYVASSANNLIQHNDVADFYYSGIALTTFRRCNDSATPYLGDDASHNNVVQYNRIHQIGQDVLSDLGGIYFFGRNTDSTAAFNEISNVRRWGHRLATWVQGTGGGYIGVGLYTDHGSHGVSLLSNVVFDAESGGLWMNEGQNRVVSNNVFAFTEEFAAGPSFNRCANESQVAPTVTADKNIMYFDSYQNQGHALMALGTPSAGSHDHNLLFEIGGGSLDVRKGTLVTSTTVIGFSRWQQNDADFSSIVADPLFADAPNWNFQLLAGSPALQPPINHVAINPPEPIGVLTGSAAYSAAGRLWAPGPDFGGMFGFKDGGFWGNPYYVVNGVPQTSCPPGYTETRIVGTPNVDHYASYCHRPRDDQKPLADFGGMYGYSNGNEVNNPLTNTFGCPAGYTPEQVLGTVHAPDVVDEPLFYCHRAHDPSNPPRTWGGIYGFYWEDLAQQQQANPNPFTRRRPICPQDFVGTTVWGTTNHDYQVVVCFAPA
jgi:parallel beta helix pectate lyase-like protein